MADLEAQHRKMCEKHKTITAEMKQQIESKTFAANDLSNLVKLLEQQMTKRFSRICELEKELSNRDVQKLPGIFI